MLLPVLESLAALGRAVGAVLGLGEALALAGILPLAGVARALAGALSLAGVGAAAMDGSRWAAVTKLVAAKTDAAVTRKVRLFMDVSPG